MKAQVEKASSYLGLLTVAGGLLYGAWELVTYLGWHHRETDAVATEYRTQAAPALEALSESVVDLSEISKQQAAILESLDEQRQQEQMRLRLLCDIDPQGMPRGYCRNQAAEEE